MSEDLFYQHVVVRGLPYERGFSYGSQTRDKIQRNIEYYKQADRLGPWSAVSTVISECYIPGLQRYWPSGWEEMRGVAAGAGVAVEDIVLLNARYDLSHVKFDGAPPATSVDECTSAIILGRATADRSVYTVQNWDMSHRLVTEDGIVYLEIHPDPSEGIPSMFIVTEAGQLGRSGCNSAGLGLTANSLQSNMDVPPDLSKSGGPVPPCGALRRLFLEQSDYAAGIKAIARTPRHVSFNLMVSSADNIGLCLEVTPKTIFRSSTTSSNEAAYMVHANHFQTAAFQSQTQLVDTYQGGSSWYRGERLEAGLREQGGIKGSLSEDDIVAALSDHAGYPFSLCEHFIEGRAHKQEQEQQGPVFSYQALAPNLEAIFADETLQIADAISRLPMDSILLIHTPALSECQSREQSPAQASAHERLGRGPAASLAASGSLHQPATIFESPPTEAGHAPICADFALSVTEHTKSELDLTPPLWSSLEGSLLDVSLLGNWPLEDSSPFSPNFDLNAACFLPDVDNHQEPLTSPPPSRSVTLLAEDREVLLHFTSTMAGFCILRNTVHDNLYMHILTSLGLFHSTILDAMLAWSALHLAHVRQTSNQNAKLRYHKAHTALLEDLAHNVSPALSLASIWFLMQYQIMLADGVDAFSNLLGLASTVVKAELYGKDASASLRRIGPIGSVILVWMSARACQVASLGFGDQLLSCLKTYPYMYELVDSSSLDTEEAEESDPRIINNPHITAADDESRQMQLCMKLSLRHVTLSGQIKVIGRMHAAGASDSAAAWEPVRASLKTLREEIEQCPSPSARAALDVAMGKPSAMPDVDPLGYNRCLLLGGYYTTLIKYSHHQPDAFDDDGTSPLPSPDECANRVLRICQKIMAKHPNSPRGVWPSKILLAGITTRDPIYQSWALRALEQAERWGQNMVKTRQLFEAALRRQSQTGQQQNVDLRDLMRQTTGYFII
ncbi:hypothetical protein HK57_00389 [Aspergillus ustus]|uniref:Peptidase C45 hydrolase domain-containing protein n=1 Tax=Aspergillus ustus TaxID=40382 RepID=A0A0C1C3Y3_ASPUT|nr:hypothetical protein HK57_00389 [Aspergillus ustus]